jgi:hypothetical protein
MHLSLKPAQSMQGENEERWEWVECWGKTSAKIAGVFSLPPSSALLRLIDRNARFGEEEQARPKGQGRAGTAFPGCGASDHAPTGTPPPAEKKNPARMQRVAMGAPSRVACDGFTHDASRRG